MSLKCRHLSHHRSSIDSGKHCRRHHAARLCAADRTLELDDSVVLDRVNPVL